MLFFNDSVTAIVYFFYLFFVFSFSFFYVAFAVMFYFRIFAPQNRLNHNDYGIRQPRREIRQLLY